jgi:hypothetical protein
MRDSFIQGGRRLNSKTTDGEKVLDRFAEEEGKKKLPRTSNKKPTILKDTLDFVG